MLSRKHMLRMRQWARVLQDTNLPQGHGFLYTEGEEGEGYCCLGIACLVAAADGEEPVPLDFRTSMGQQRCFPSDDVDEYFLGPAEFRPTNADGAVTLSHLPLFFSDNDEDESTTPWEANDELAKTFPEIGRAIDDWLNSLEAGV